jgi:hypothetical protein
MSTATRDLLPVLIPLAMMGILTAVFVGTTLAKSTQQAQPVATASPSPVITTGAAVKVSPSPSPAPSSTPMAQPTATGLVSVKQSGTGCTPAFDAPNGQQKICFQSGTFKVTGQQDGFTSLTDGTNNFWMKTESLEPVQEKPPEQLLPPQPQANWT